MRPMPIVVYGLLFVAACSSASPHEAPSTFGNVTVFEHARLVVGDGSAPIEDSAFLVEADRFTRVGRAGAIDVPDRAVRVDLSGKTVMPALVDLHSHLGFVNAVDGSQSKENFTRENLLDHLDRYAYTGHAATVSLGTDFPDFIWQVREESRQAPFTGARYFTVGRGLAWPGSGPNAPSRNDVPYPIVSEWQARVAVRELAGQQADFVKIWVDDRGGTQTKTTPPIYRAAIDEAHKHGMRAVAHVYTLEDVKGLILAGVDGFTHMVRDQAVDEELLALLRERPHVWNVPVLTPANSGGSAPRAPGTRPAWLDDPLLRAIRCPASLERWGQAFERDTTMPSAMGGLPGRNTSTLHAAGVRIALGSHDEGGNRIVGWGSHMELEAFVNWVGMTPHEAIIAGTSAAAEILGVDDLGSIGVGKKADFVVLEANPLDDIMNTRRIAQVYLRGNEVDRAAMTVRWQAACSAASATN